MSARAKSALAPNTTKHATGSDYLTRRRQHRLAHLHIANTFAHCQQILNKVVDRTCDNSLVDAKEDESFSSEFESLTRSRSCQSTQIIHIIQPIPSPSTYYLSSLRSSLFIVQDSFKSRVALRTLMQAFESSVYRGTRTVGGNAVGRGSSRGPASTIGRGEETLKEVLGEGRGKGGIGSGGRVCGRPRLTHCTSFNYISFVEDCTRMKVHQRLPLLRRWGRRPPHVPPA